MKEKIEWTSEMIFELKRLQELEENLSFNVIAERMSKTFGVHFTRNSTVGKAHRLKLPPRPIRERVTQENTRPRLEHGGKRVAKVRLVPRKPIIGRRGIRLIQLRKGQCKWPSGEGPYTFCGKPIVDDGAPYCAHHSALAYVPPKKKFA